MSLISESLRTLGGFFTALADDYDATRETADTALAGTQAFGEHATAVSEALADLTARVAKLESAPPVTTPAPITLPKGFKHVQDFGIDWQRAYNWSDSKVNIYLPSWGQGPHSWGDPTRVMRNADKSVTLDAAAGPANAAGKSWFTGSIQVDRPKVAAGRVGAVVRVTDPSAVAAFFGYANGNSKEIDFELTKGKDGSVAWTPAVHMPKAGGGMSHSTRRALKRAPLRSATTQVLEYDLRADRCDFYCDGVLFETVTPADMSDTPVWDTTTGMAQILCVEKHEGWAGWDYASGKAQMVVHGLLIPGV